MNCNLSKILKYFQFLAIFAIAVQSHKHRFHHRINGNHLQLLPENQPEATDTNDEEKWLLRKPTSGPASSVSAGGVWPLPQKIHYGGQNRTLRRDGISFQFRGIRDVDCDILNFARNTYLKEWFFPWRDASTSVGSLIIVIHLHSKCPRLDEYPQEGMDEEYRLRVPFTGDATLDAQEIWGVLRGLETISQLIFYTQGSYFIRTATIHDWPEYSVRGIMLDTSRHYLRKNLILRQIDLMAQNKMNLLHWHIVDMESFPYVSKRFPNLSKAGAFTQKHVYTRNTVEEIIKYARLRGVRVMVEFDTPGHMSSWDGQFQLLAECRNATGHFKDSAMIDPTLEQNYQFLEDFFKEVFETFPERFIHLGGDEAGFWTEDCWGRNPEIQKFMRDHGLLNITMLENFYFSRLQNIINRLMGADPARRMVFWQEVFTNNNPDPKAIVHIWQSATPAQRAKDIAAATTAGHKVILSACWYLNYIDYGSDWKEGRYQLYYCDPRAFKGTYQQKQLVLGGIATMWGEYVDGTNLESRLWPRASAVAERLWSSPTQTTDADVAWPRLHEHRCRLIARGFRAQPINGAGDYCPSEWDDPM
ncbi:glycosyl hydrolase family 20, catalytic domain-containing protein [Ditylenchus destructor]|uniref:Beta-hexosaminidase n=1 Tax=Ditylenchus destructor TaxID=166010 RepID=A0AAD4N291_9BILA|nr:glycosyl hydrolase family 20, catalytic domain-containing protein [Ditylenchus destructor]